MLQVKLLPCPDPGWVGGLLGDSGRCGRMLEMKIFTPKAACECPGVARTNDHKMRDFKWQKYITSVVGVRGPKSRVGSFQRFWEGLCSTPPPDSW